ncbi:MAG: CHAT domain-containing protein [Sphingomonadaceae bacterium]
MRCNHNFGTCLAVVVLVCATPAHAQFGRPSLADSFRLGTGGGVLCQVQAQSRSAAIKDIFDRAWAIVCRDAARPIGRLYALRGDQATALARLADMRKSEARCASETQEIVDEIGAVPSRSCQVPDANIGYKVLSFRQRNVTWVAEGLSAYDSALKLGLRTILADRIVDGKVTVATTSVDDSAAFARVQAATLDPDQALAEGYRRNNVGNYPEAAEFFDTLQQQLSASPNDRERLGEYLINRALQKSNMGDFAEADALFAEAGSQPLSDRVQTRLSRNFEAVHLLNQQRYDDALSRLDQPVAPNAATAVLPGSAIEIGFQVAAEINAGSPTSQRLGSTESTALTAQERARLLDAQAMQLRGTLLRLTGKPSESVPLLERAMSDVMAVRDGRVVSVIRLRSQILAETGLALEDQRDVSGAEAKLRESVTLLETRYPQSAAVNGARARLAAFLARQSKVEPALAEYRQVMTSLADVQSHAAGLGNLLAPYFDLLTGSAKGSPTAAADVFLASQLLVRPGIADTQALLARELSDGTNEGARFFRQSRNLARDIERSRIEAANLLLLPNQTTAIRAAIDALQLDIGALEKEQAATQAKLSEFPQFRAISARTITLDELTNTLKPGEAYLKLSVVGRSVFALFADKAGALAYKLPITASQLDNAVDTLRETIAVEQGGQVTTYAFDVVLGRKLFVDLVGPVADRITASKHIIFEPDGGMLRLPLNLLITDQASVDAYQQRIKAPAADEFDFRGIQWLGRGRSVSTTVSAKAFRDARSLPASNATRAYIGFGQNAPLTSSARIYRASASAGGVDCNWPASQWNRPISASELREAQSLIGAPGSTLVTGAAFTDAAVLNRTDLADYRIIHFATHGLVTAPRTECPARPALVTSFGGADSDGLLSFKEIFDMKINADIVILSACDTAGKATISATREAGVTSGGGNALDGLVRAFIGAGGRAILASHWPAPDDFDATKILISGLFQAARGTSIGTALDQAQTLLMDKAETSHPYYWAGFAVIGDGGQSVLPERQ